jgi:sterol desaturase/sphingolipid hydroxylase (fatty acid hydroxylase superfamily)
MVLGFLLLTNLQHSHFWITFPGFWGNIFLSPAHHQVHHSKDPAHFNKNLGSTLAVWDWLFGTLHKPSRHREKLEFGVDGIADPHGFKSAIILPFFEAVESLRLTKTRRFSVRSDAADLSGPYDLA